MKRFQFDERHAVICWSLQGEINERLFAEYIEASAETNPRFPARAVILDLSGVQSFDVSPKTLKKLAAKAPTLPANLPRIIIAPTPFTYGMARMFTIVSEEHRPNAYVVRTMDEACRILRVDSLEFQSIRSRSCRTVG
jgi:hypothetical protein